VSFESYRYAAPEFVPAKYKTASSVTAKWEANPEKSARLAAARVRIAKTFSSEATDLKAMRLSRGMSQAQVAKATGTSQPQIARIEAGTANVLCSTMRSLCAALSCSMVELDAALAASEQRAQDRG